MKVLFVASPFKSQFIERMAKYFSKNVSWQIVVPDYPYVKRRKRSFTDKFIDIAFGDRKLLKVIERFEPDVIYTDNAQYGAQIKVASYLKREKIPLIVHLRGDWWTEYWAWYRFASWRRRCLSIQSYSKNWFALSTATLITPICRWLEGRVKHHLPLKKTEVVYQGVDPQVFYKEEELELEHPAVAIIQNHTVYLKVEGLIMFRKVIEKMKDVHFYITTGEREGQSYFPLIQKKLGDNKNVTFLENISWPRGVRKLLSACDIYVLASGLDCCPTTVLEASLMEKPVLASRIGGVPEIIVEGKTGWTIDNRDTSNWIKKIQLLVEDVRLTSHLGREGRKWVSESFNWKKIGKQVESIIEDVSDKNFFFTI